MENLIKYSIMFGPTILFVLIVLIRMLIGYASGARRQVIFVTHSIIAFAICLILFFVLVENKFFDKLILDFVNLFMGKDGLEQSLGVNPNCTTMKEVLVQYLPSQLNLFDGMELILRDNGAYLLTLVNVSYHIILALVLYYVYLLLEGIMYIFYLIFYSERKHRNKKNAKYEDGVVDKPYVKYKKYGATIGLFRGVIRGLICLAFIGSIFFIVSGVGNKNRKTYTTNKESYDLGFTIYKEIGNYGEYGIYKVLNMCKDKDDVPYYLYAVDLVYQGGLKDENRNIDTNIHLIEELNAYVEFSADTFDLLMKYGSDKLTPIILGEYEGNTMDVILEIMANSSFQAEFKILINNFDAKTYFINFALSLVDSITNYLDEVEFTKTLSADALDVLSIAFKKGYLSETIPYERSLINSKKDVELGYVKPSSLLTSNDARIVLNALLEIINMNEIYKNDSNYALRVVETLTKYIKNLSIIDSSRSNELNPVLKRLYAFVDSKYLVAKSENNSDEMVMKQQQLLTNVIYIDKEYDSIDWVSELGLLVDSIDDILALYNDVYLGTKDAFSSTLSIFDENSLNHRKNIRIYNDLLQKLSYSKVLGLAAGSAIVNQNIETYIISNIAPSFTIPDNIRYASEVIDKETYHGELYYFLSGIEKLCINDQNINIMDELKKKSEESEETEDIFDLLEKIASVLASSDEDGIFIENLAKSKIIHSLLSAYLIDNKKVNDSFEIYTDDSSIKKNNLIDYNELVKFFKVAPDTLELVKPFVTGDDKTSSDFIELLDDPRTKKALDSKIFEGSFSSILANNVESGDIVLPPSFVIGVGWVTKDVNDISEIRKIIRANDTGFDFKAIVDGDTEAVNNAIKNLDEETTSVILDSNILYYSISKYLVDKSSTLSEKVEIIIPNYLMITHTIELNEGTTLSAYRLEKNTLSVFLSNAKMFIGDDIDAVKLLKELKYKEEVLDNSIYSATMAYSTNSEGGLINDSIKGSLYIPSYIRPYAEKDALKEDFSSNNPWKYEVKNLVFGSDKIVDLDTIESFDEIDSAKIKNGILHIDNNELRKVYSSNILAFTISKDIRNSLGSDDEDSNKDLIHVDLAYKAGSIEEDSDNKQYGVYLYSEIQTLVGMLQNVSIKTGKDTFDEVIELVGSTLTIGEITSEIKNSYILTKTVTNKVLSDVNNGIRVLKTDYIPSYKTFSPDALSLFLDGILLMAKDTNITIDQVSEKMNFENMNMPKQEDIDVIAMSDSLMATITYNIKFKVTEDPTIEEKILFNSDYCYIRTTIYEAEPKQAVVSKSELINIVNLLGEKSIFNDSSIDVTSLIENFVKEESSNYPNMLRNVINDYLINMCKKEGASEEMKAAIKLIKYENVVILDANDIYSEQYATNEQLLMLVSLMPKQ